VAKYAVSHSATFAKCILKDLGLDRRQSGVTDHFNHRFQVLLKQDNLQFIHWVTSLFQTLTNHRAAGIADEVDESGSFVIIVQCEDTKISIRQFL